MQILLIFAQSGSQKGPNHAMNGSKEWGEICEKGVMAIGPTCTCIKVHHGYTSASMHL